MAGATSPIFPFLGPGRIRFAAGVRTCGQKPRLRRCHRARSLDRSWWL